MWWLVGGRLLGFGLYRYCSGFKPLFIAFVAVVRLGSSALSRGGSLLSLGTGISLLLGIWFIGSVWRRTGPTPLPSG